MAIRFKEQLGKIRNNFVSFNYDRFLRTLGIIFIFDFLFLLISFLSSGILNFLYDRFIGSTMDPSKLTMSVSGNLIMLVSVFLYVFMFLLGFLILAVSSYLEWSNVRKRYLDEKGSDRNIFSRLGYFFKYASYYAFVLLFIIAVFYVYYIFLLGLEQSQNPILWIFAVLVMIFLLYYFSVFFVSAQLKFFYDELADGSVSRDLERKRFFSRLFSSISYPLKNARFFMGSFSLLLLLFLGFSFLLTAIFKNGNMIYFIFIFLFLIFSKAFYHTRFDMSYYSLASKSAGRSAEKSDENPAGSETHAPSEIHKAHKRSSLKKTVRLDHEKHLIKEKHAPVHSIKK